MRTASAAYLAHAANGEIPKLKAYLYSAAGVPTELSGDDFMESVTFSGGTSPAGEFTVGGAVTGLFVFALNNFGGKFDGYDFAGAYIVPLTYYDEGDEVRMGRYYLASHKTLGHVINCVAYDVFRLMDMESFAPTYPITAQAAVNQIASNHGITVNTFENGNASLPDPGMSLTERQALAYIAGVTGNYARVTADGNLVLEWYDTSSPIAQSTIFGQEIEVADSTITGVRFGDILTGSEGYVIDVSGNPYIETANPSEALSRIYNRVRNTAFRPGTVTILANAAIEGGDVISFTDDGNIVKVIVTAYTYKMMVTEDVSCDAVTASDTDLRRRYVLHGADGVGIKSVTVLYGVSSSVSTYPTTWYPQSQMPVAGENEYLWTQTITDYTDDAYPDSVVYTYAKQGKQGETGQAGTSITVESVKYQAGTSPTQHPTGTWYDDPVAVSAGLYLWTMTTFSDGNVAYGVAKQGENGDNFAWNLITGTAIPDVDTTAGRPHIIGQTSDTYCNAGTCTTAPHGMRITNSGASRTQIRFGSATVSTATLNGLEAGKTYTLSFDAKWRVLSGTAETATRYMEASLYDNSGSETALARTAYYRFGTVAAADRGTDMEGRCEFTFTVPANATKLYILIANNRTTNSNYAAGDYIEISNLKLEEGETVTPWAPAYEELKGDKGDQGDPGVSPTVTVSKSDGVATITFTDATGTQTTTILDGEDGAAGHSPTITTQKTGTTTKILADGTEIGSVSDGDDGHSPVVTASKSGGVTTVKVDGTSVATINDGSSVTIKSATKSGDTTTVVLQDASGTQTLTIVDGEDGENGTPGLNGYVHTAWATSADGTEGFSTTVSAGKTYFGSYTDNTAADSTNPSDYNWSLIKGDKGDKGDTGSRGATWYAGTKITGTSTTATIFSGSGITDALVGDHYLNTSTQNVYVCTVAGDASVAKWKYEQNIKGETGAPGGAGSNSYVHIKYSNDGSTFTGNSGEDPGAYLGIYADNTATDSTTFSDYTWTKIEGEPGADGEGFIWNLLEEDAMTKLSYTESGLTFEYEGDGWWHVSGTASLTSAKYVALYGVANTTTLINKTGKVYASVENDNALSGTDMRLQIGRKIGGATSVSYAYVAGTETGKALNSDASVNIIVTCVRVQIQTTFSGSTVDGRFRIKITEGEEYSSWAPALADLPAATCGLTSYSHLFAGSTTGALAGSAESTVVAYKGGTPMKATIGTITGMPTGMTVAISGNGTTSAKFTVTVKTTLTQQDGELTIPVTVDNTAFTLIWAWAVSKEGAKGDTGEDGEDGKMLYGTSASTASTQDKIVVCEEANALYAGMSILIKFKYSSTADTPRLNINGLGPVSIYFNGDVGSNYSNLFQWGTGAEILFVYDGTNFVPSGYPCSYYGTCTTGASAVAKVSSIAGAVICKGTKVGITFTNTNTATAPTLNVSSTGAKSILAAGATIPAGSYYNWVAGAHVTFTFNGAAWEMDGTTGLYLIHGKNKVFYQAEAPAASLGLEAGDTWFDTNDGYAIYEWNGTQWSAVELGENAIAANAIKAKHIMAGIITSEMINAQGISASKIKGDILQSMDGNTYFDLENGLIWCESEGDDFYYATEIGNGMYNVFTKEDFLAEDDHSKTVSVTYPTIQIYNHTMEYRIPEYANTGDPTIYAIPDPDGVYGLAIRDSRWIYRYNGTNFTEPATTYETKDPVLLGGDYDEPWFGITDSEVRAYNQFFADKGIEVFNEGGTSPYIDFHYENSTSDFSTRMIANAENQLQIQTSAGKAVVKSGNLELFYATPFIDFHFNRDDTQDYTSRIIETSSGVLKSFPGAIQNGSDQALKTDITPIDSQYIDLIDKLQPVEFRYKMGSGEKHLGFIAQDVDEALEELGITDKPLVSAPVNEDDYYGLDYTQIIPALVAYVKELRAEIDELKKGRA